MRNKNLWYVGLFAVAMAYIESAVVVYLRRLHSIGDLMTSLPPFDPQVGAVEVGRELATLVMLLAVGLVAGKKFQSRLGFAIFAFGLWDIFYYFWLKVFINWPRSLLDIDILFLIPLPWWGPVLAPVLIAALMAVGGARAVLPAVTETLTQLKPTPFNWTTYLIGFCLTAYAIWQATISKEPK